MGERFRQARLEAGLSQAQLSQNLISRNMLSQIESGAAKPSLGTLEVLAQRLHKPVGYFFGEETEDLTGRNLAEKAWQAYGRGDIQLASKILNSREDLKHFEDIRVLRSLILLKLAGQAVEEKRYPYAKQLLRWVLEETRPFPELRRKAVLLLGKVEGQKAEPLCKELPSMDEELLLRARAYLEKMNPEKAEILLEAAEDKNAPDWAMLRGKTCLQQKKYKPAVGYFHQAEQRYPEEVTPYLEQCYRELGDFKQAYFYACRQK